MYILYSIDAQNPRFPNERVMHCIDTDLADRIFVQTTTQGDRAVKKLVENLDDFIGDQRKDLHKPVRLVGLDNDPFGTRVISDLIRQLPVYVTVKYATLNKLFRGA